MSCVLICERMRGFGIEIEIEIRKGVVLVVY